MISSEQLGERLIGARGRAGLTQAEVADRMGIDQTALAAFEHGARRPSSAEIVRLADVLGTSIHELVREGSVLPEIPPEELAHEASASGEHRLGAKIPDRYVVLAIATYDQELLTELELAHYLRTDIVDARRIRQEHRRRHLGDDGR